MICPLCGSAAECFVQFRERDYYLCPLCRFIFVPPNQHLSADEEKERYLEHENSLDNEGYVRMFEEKLDLIAQHCGSVQTVLDFGCGYEPVLKTLLQRRGMEAFVYDRFFFPDWIANRRYDLIISTETFEHLKTPAMELERLVDCLNPGGYLAVMTRQVPLNEGQLEAQTFADWYYLKDPTHIGFFTGDTFRWLAKTRDLQIIFDNGFDFVIFRLQ